MCKLHWHKGAWSTGGRGNRREEAAPDAQRTPYEGETVRLDAERQERTGYYNSARWHAFPWWMLWFIWPLMWIVKGLVLAVAGLVGAAGEALPAAGSFGFSFWPILLIILGIALWRRR